MGNIVTYLQWRGDLTFEQSEFNEIDNLILAQLAYVDFSQVALGEDISLFNAYQLIVANNLYRSFQLVPLSIELLAETAKSPRFRNTIIRSCCDKFDPTTHLQFAALHFALEDGTTYIAFRGTDSTLTGWREDFMMGSGVVLAQTEALDYLCKTMKSNQSYRIGGHSKGGNLAVYAASMVDLQLQSQIRVVYTNDGPGLSSELLANSHYALIQDRIHRIVPEFSIIGNLFEQQGDKKKIIKSTTSGLMQHDAMTWEIKGKAFRTVPKHASEAIAINEIITHWMGEISKEDCAIFVDDLFDSLAASGAQKTDELASCGIDGFETILRTMVKAEKKSKMTFFKLLQLTWRRGKKINFIGLFKDSDVLRGAFLALLGLFFMEIPEQALIVSTITAIFLFFLSATRWLIRKANTRTNTKYYIRIYAAIVMTVLIFFFFNSKMIIFSSNFILGICFVCYGFYSLRKVTTNQKKRKCFKVLHLMEVLLYFAFGLVALVTTTEILGTYVLTVGTFLIVTGLRMIITKAYQMTDIEE